MTDFIDRVLMNNLIFDFRVDDREISNGIFDILINTQGVTATKQRLSVGDYRVDNRLLFERKTLLDLTLSIKDGRLFRQALGLAESPLHGIIILEGTSASLKESGMRREAIQGALITLSVNFGIPLLRSMDQQETAQLMLYTARQARTFAQGALPRHAKRPKGRLHTQLNILQGLPGVGPERARALLEAFGSVEAVFSAAIDQLTAIDGIGLNTAKRIRWAVQETAPDYQIDDALFSL